jgi:hypothetical protein
MAKTEQTTTIEISTPNSERLHSLAEKLQKILRKKKVSLDQAISVLLTTKSVEETISDMILENCEAH